MQLNSLPICEPKINMLKKVVAGATGRSIMVNPAFVFLLMSYR